MDRLVDLDILKSSILYSDKQHECEGYNELYVADFGDIRIKYFHEVFDDCDLIVTFNSDQSRIEYSIERGNFKVRYWKRIYRYYEKDVLVDSWDGVSPFDNTSEIAAKIRKLDDFVDDLMDAVVHWRDVILPARSAVKIQSAFRGWRVRHKYRYDPNNRLGYHVIRKMFDD
jgi:hypothetical protein